ncbi:AraC family transcriptional regulator [Tistrella bauzanensis]|nr:AraC family transcriptional regulator [Tistrella bauzanensis]
MPSHPECLTDRPEAMADPSSYPPAADLISELLMGMRIDGVRYRRIQITDPCGIRFGDDADADGGWAQFHFVARGTVFLRSPAGVVHRLAAGDAALLPRGGVHALLSAPDLPARDLAGFQAHTICERVEMVRACDGDACPQSGAVVFSGCMAFDLGGMHPLLALMPEVMSVATLLDRNPEILPMLEAMEREACAGRAGFAAILARLADVVAASIIRGWVECGCGEATGWVQALRDPRLGRVILAMHREPGRAWTLVELAALMGASRSVFAERFLAATGTTPLRYLTDLRMRLAAGWIARERQSIDSVAERLGYASQAAFSRAFKRVTGHPPGMARLDHHV